MLVGSSKSPASSVGSEVAVRKAFTPTSPLAAIAAPNAADPPEPQEAASTPYPHSEPSRSSSVDNKSNSAAADRRVPTNSSIGSAAPHFEMGTPPLFPTVGSSNDICNSSGTRFKPLSASAAPWYPPPSLHNRDGCDSVASQPMAANDFPCEPAASSPVAQQLYVSPVTDGSMLNWAVGGASQGRSVGRESASAARTMAGTPSFVADAEDDTVCYVQFHNDDGWSEEAMIQHMAQQGYWDEGNYVEGLSSLQEQCEYEAELYRQQAEMFGFDDLESNSSAYDDDDDRDDLDDSLDSEQREWIEEQLRPVANPDDFFF